MKKLKEHKYWEYIAVNWYLVHYLTFYCIMVPWEMVPWDTVICWMFHGRWCHETLLYVGCSTGDGAMRHLYVGCLSFQSSRPVFCEVRCSIFNFLCNVLKVIVYPLFFCHCINVLLITPFGIFNISLQHKHVMYRETCVIYSYGKTLMK